MTSDNTTNPLVNIYEEEIMEGGYRFVKSVLEVCRVDPRMDGSNITCVAKDNEGSEAAVFSLAVNGMLF